MNPRSIVRLSLAVLVSLGALGSGVANAQQPAASPDADSPAATTHHDPIVQKRSEVREANRQRRAKTSQARSQFRDQSRQARAERNQSVQESRQRATDAMGASAAK